MPDIRMTVKPSLGRLGAAFKAIKIGAALDKAMLEFGYRIEAETKPVTPVDTGLLRASIMTIPLGGTLGGVVVKPHVFYAGWVHEGTRYMRERPFFRWGLEKAMPYAPEGIKMEIEKEIDDKLRKVK